MDHAYYIICDYNESITSHIILIKTLAGIFLNGLKLKHLITPNVKYVGLFLI